LVAVLHLLKIKYLLSLVFKLVYQLWRTRLSQRLGLKLIG